MSVIVGTINNVSGTPIACKIAFTPLTTAADVLTCGIPTTTQSDGNSGAFSVSLTQGTYNVSVDDQGKVFRIAVPNDNLVYAITALKIAETEVTGVVATSLATALVSGSVKTNTTTADPIVPLLSYTDATYVTSVIGTARVTSSSGLTPTIDLATSGVTPGTFTKLTVDQYGRSTFGATATPGDIGAQPLDSDLTALAALATNGLAARTGSGTWAVRSVAGTSGRIAVTDGDGVAANPTVDLVASGVTAGTYTKITFDTYGRATVGASATTTDIAEGTNQYFTNARVDSRITSTWRGLANGLASLDAGAKIPVAQLPDSIVGQVEYQATWNASTNIPAIPAAATGNKGHYYVVATAGTTSIDGIAEWAVGDWIISNGTAWQKVDNTDAVSTVFGRMGAVVAATNDYTWAQINKATSSLADITTRLYSDLQGLTNAVTFSHVQQIATARLLGRTTAATGNVEELSAATARTLLNVADGANNYVHPNHSGDVNSVNDGATTIAANAVTLAKFQQIATASLLGRNTAATGNAEVLSATTARSILNVADGANNYVHPNHTGDVTSLADGATTIANLAVTTGKVADDAITFAKVQNIATARFLGRNTAATGDVEELTAATARGMLFTGTPDGTKFAKDDGTFAVPVGSVTNSGSTTVLGADVTFTAAFASIVSITLPDAGTYLIAAVAGLRTSSGTADYELKLYNATDAADVSGTDALLTQAASNANDQLTLMKVVTVASSKVIHIYGMATATTYPSSKANRTSISYVKLT